MKHVLLSMLVVGVFAGRNDVAASTAVSKRVASRIASVVSAKVAPLTVLGALCLSLAGCELQQQMLPQFTASDKPAKASDSSTATPAVVTLNQRGAWDTVSGTLGSGTLSDSDAYLPNDRFTTTIDISYEEDIAEPSATFALDLQIGSNTLTLSVSSTNFTTNNLFDLVDSAGNNAGYGRHGGRLSSTNNRLGGLGQGAPLTSLFIRGSITNDRLMVIYIEPEVNDSRLTYITYASSTAFEFLGQPAAQHFAFRGTLHEAN